MRAPLYIACAAALAACTPSRPERPERPARPPPRGPLGVPLAALDAAPEPSELAADAALPEPVARCVARSRAETPAVLAGALAVLDEPALVESACRLDVAVRLRSPRLCEGVSFSAIRDVCRARAAMAAGTPELCPAAQGARARDPVCVAIAARDLGLCAAASSPDRARCEAIARGDPSRCARLDPLLRPGCLRELAAVAGVVPRVDARSRAASIPSVGTLSAGDDAGVTALAWVSRGVFLDEEGALWIVDAARGWPAIWTLAGDAPVVAVKLPLRGVAPGATVSGEGALILPRLRGMRTEDGTLRVDARVRERPRARGDRVRVEVRLRGTSAGAPVERAVEVDSFVRDVVPARALGQDAW